MANGQGGLLFIGVENDGAITGLHASHRTRRELLAAFISSRTVPPLSVQVSFETLPANNGDVTIAVLRIPAGQQMTATSDGRLLIRYLDTHGQPGCRPLIPMNCPAGGPTGDRPTSLLSLSLRSPGTTLTR